MHIPIIFSEALSLALNRTIICIIIDRLLIKGKGRGELVPTKENRNVLEVTSR